MVAFARDAEGALTEVGSYPTGGLGTGEGLGSQAAIVVSDDHTYLFAVNAGSDEISSFRIFPDHLALADVVSSGGVRPISLTARGDRLYALNADGAGSVSGFAVDDGELTAIEGATRPLSSGEGPTDPAQVALSPDGELLVVTEKGTSRLTTYAVAGDGTLGEPVVTDSSGQAPFGFAFTPSGTIVVSEAGGGPAGGGPKGTSAVSSYAPQPDGCDDAHLYALAGAADVIVGMRIEDDGRLTRLGDSPVPATAVGLAGF